MHFYLQVKSLACVLLRRLFTNKFEEIWEQLSAEQQSLVKQELLSAVEAEEKMLLKRKICEAVAELARSMLGMKTDSAFSSLIFICLH